MDDKESKKIDYKTAKITFFTAFIVLISTLVNNFFKKNEIKEKTDIRISNNTGQVASGNINNHIETTYKIELNEKNYDPECKQTKDYIKTVKKEISKALTLKTTKDYQRNLNLNYWDIILNKYYEYDCSSMLEKRDSIELNLKEIKKLLK